MYLRDTERLQEQVQLDLDAGLIAKIIFACLGVGGVIFYLGLTLGQGDAMARIRGSSEAVGLKQLKGSLQSLAPAPDPSVDDSLLLFPTLLSRRADQRIDRDELSHTLDQFLPRNLESQEEELARFREEVLRERFGLAVDPRTGEVVHIETASLNPVDSTFPGGTVARAPVRGAEAGPRPEPAPEKIEVVVAAEPAPVDDDEEAPAPERQTLGKYTLQLQSFRDPGEARLFHELMQDRGYHPFVQRSNLGDKGVWHRVRIGRFMKMKAAQSFKRKFEREQGFSTRIMSL